MPTRCPMSPPAIRDRVRELRRVRAGDLLPHAQNWRRHPPQQRAALRAVLAEIGYADALLARETPDGLMLIDGHLRREETPDALVPVLVLDVDEAEAAKLLVTLDPLAALATADAAALDVLLRDVQTGDEALGRMLADLAVTSGLLPRQPTAPANDPAAEWQGMPEFDQPSAEGITVIVHMQEADLPDFEKLIGGPVCRNGVASIGGAARSVWF